MKKTVDALVLRVMDSGESDRRILVLSPTEGKMWLTAKGARGIKSKYTAVCRLFCYSNFEYYEKNGFRWISAGSVNNDFSAVSSDLCDFALASYILQLADECSGEGVEAEDILRMTLNTLYAIEKKLRPLKQIKAVYELYAAGVSGMAPDVFECDACKRENFEDGEQVWLDVMNGAVICGKCLKKRAGNLPLPEIDVYATRNILLPLNSSALEAMRYVLTASPSRLFAFSLSDTRSIELFAKAAETFLLNHLERDFDTLNFYRTVCAEK